MLWGVIFSVALAGFLTGCLIVLLWDDLIQFAGLKLSDELGCDRADGDWPHVPDDLKVSRFHSERNSRERI